MNMRSAICELSLLFAAFEANKALSIR